MLGRVVLILLVGWVIVGIGMLVLGGDDPVPTGALDRAEEARGLPTGPEPLIGSGNTPADNTPADSAPADNAPAAPTLERSTAGESAEALIARLGRAHEKADRAAITAWIRAHPDRIRELMVALTARVLNYADHGWARFFGDVFGPLRDLEAQLVPQLIASFDVVRPPPANLRPAYGALLVLAPLSKPSRTRLLAWADGQEMSRLVEAVGLLVIADAEDGQEVRTIVGRILAPRPEGAPQLYGVYGDVLMREIAGLGLRGAALVPAVSKFAMDTRVTRDVARALIAIGADDPATHRALLVTMYATPSGAHTGQTEGFEFLLRRPDSRAILLRGLEDDSARVRLGTIALIDYRRLDLGPAAVLPALLRTLTDPAATWRERAMDYLPRMAERADQVVPTLEAMFRSPEEQQWITAALALRKLATYGSGRRFDVADAVRDALRHDNVRVRRVVAEGLMHYAPDAAVPMLESALSDEDVRVREIAIEGLAALAERKRDAGALAALRAAAKHADETVADTARAWIAELEETLPRDRSGK